MNESPERKLLREWLRFVSKEGEGCSSPVAETRALLCSDQNDAAAAVGNDGGAINAGSGNGADRKPGLPPLVAAAPSAREALIALLWDMQSNAAVGEPSWESIEPRIEAAILALAKQVGEPEGSLQERIQWHQTQAAMLTQELLGDPMKTVSAAPERGK